MKIYKDKLTKSSLSDFRFSNQHFDQVRKYIIDEHWLLELGWKNGIEIVYVTNEIGIVHYLPTGRMNGVEFIEGSPERVEQLATAIKGVLNLFKDR